MYENKKKRWRGYFGQTVSEEVSKNWVNENFSDWFVNMCLDKPNNNTIYTQEMPRPTPILLSQASNRLFFAKWKTQLCVQLSSFWPYVFV